jgi:hypothetical protein
MKLTLNKIVIIDEQLNTLLEKDLKIKLSYKIGKFKLKTFEVANLAKAKRDELIRKYGETEGDNIIVKPTSEHFLTYSKEVNELFSMEEEVPDFSLTLEELEGLNATPLFCMNMQDVITE